MKKKMRITITTGILLAMVMLTACGTKNSSTSDSDTTEMSEEPSMATDSYYGNKAETATEEAAVAEDAMGSGSVVSDTSIISGVVNTNQKLIKTVGLSMQTKTFDTLIDGITEQVEQTGGYVESSSISGNSYYSEGNRYAWLRLRIPADKLEGFVTLVSDMGNVISKNESVEDITLQYVDVESHKEALNTEQERLLELLEKAETMEDIIAIESRLSAVRYELQSYESTLRVYDNQVAYSTVTVDIQEVERESPVLEERSFFEEISYRLSENFYKIGQGCRSFAIWFISSLPYLVIVALIAAIAFVVVRVVMKKRGKKKEPQEIEKKDIK